MSGRLALARSTRAWQEAWVQGAAMRRWAGTMVVGVVVLGAVLRPAALRAAEAPASDGGYATYCASCHGPTGRGDGPDADIFIPRPRNLRDGFLARYDTEALVRTIRDGAPLSLALDPAALRTRADEVEVIVAHLERLPKIDWDLVERGEEIYVDRCELCHGPFGQPGKPPASVARAPRDLSDPRFQRAMSDKDLIAVVQHGRKGMPAIPALRPADDARALVAFVRVLSPGYVLYARYCSGCHGEDGRADDVVDPGRGPTVVFDRAYLAGHDAEALRIKVWHMLAEQRPAMPHFRTRLSAERVRAIVDYLKRTE